MRSIRKKMSLENQNSDADKLKELYRVLVKLFNIVKKLSPLARLCCLLFLLFSILYCFVILSQESIFLNATEVLLGIFGFVVTILTIKLLASEQCEGKELIGIILFLYLEYWIRAYSFQTWTLLPHTYIIISEILCLMLFVCIILYTNKALIIDKVFTLFLCKGLINCTYIVFEHKSTAYYDNFDAIPFILTLTLIFYFSQLIYLGIIVLKREKAK